MAKRLVFGNPPFQFLAAHLAQDSDFLNDAHQLVQIDDDLCSSLVSRLTESNSFLDLSGITAIVKEVLGPPEDAEELATIVHRIARIVHDSEMAPSDALDQLSKAIEKEATDFDSQTRAKLIERIRQLTVEPLGIAKQIKARQLVNATGAELDDFRVLCDIRPIFDQTRERIDGAVPLTILRLEYTLPSGDSAVAEVRLTEGQLKDFADRIADAQRKLGVIKELLTLQQISIPRTKATISEDTE